MKDRKRRRGEGTVFATRSGGWGFRVTVNGRKRVEQGSWTESEARDRLDAYRAKAILGQLPTEGEAKTTVAAIVDRRTAWLETRGRSTGSFKVAAARAMPLIGEVKATELTAARIDSLIRELRKRFSPASTNRSLAALRSAFRLAAQEGTLTKAPHFTLLPEDNARSGFLERADFEKLVAELPEPVDDLVRFAYATGWRKGELLALSWARVDRKAGEIRLTKTKNGRPRMIPITGDLEGIIERAWTNREFLDGDVTTLSALVFHQGGFHVGNALRESWTSACKAVGLPGVLFHDLRRSAVRNMIRSGVPETVAMSISGHLTRSVFDRYNVTSSRDQSEALAKVAVFEKPTKGQPAESGGESKT